MGNAWLEIIACTRNTQFKAGCTGLLTVREIKRIEQPDSPLRSLEALPAPFLAQHWQDLSKVRMERPVMTFSCS